MEKLISYPGVKFVKVFKPQNEICFYFDMNWLEQDCLSEAKVFINADSFSVESEKLFLATELDIYDQNGVRLVYYIPKPTINILLKNKSAFITTAINIEKSFNYTNGNNCPVSKDKISTLLKAYIKYPERKMVKRA